jgi:hypothetical protein
VVLLVSRPRETGPDGGVDGFVGVVLAAAPWLMLAVILAAVFRCTTP